MAVEVGQEAPDFTLRDQNREEVTLSSFRGQKSVLLVFFPFAFSGICTSELCQVRDELPRFEDEDVQVIGISVDHPFALKSWAAQEGYLFPLLSDFWPHGEVAKPTACSTSRRHVQPRHVPHRPVRQGRLRRAQPARGEARPVRLARGDGGPAGLTSQAG